VRPQRDLTDPRRARDRLPLEPDRDPTFEEVVVPEEFGPVELVVDDHKVKRHAFSQDDHGDWYLREGLGGVRIGHPGLLANDLLQLFTTRYAASRVVGLHTAEELWFRAPVEVGSRVVLSGRYVEKYERRGQGHVVMEAAATDVDGRVLLEHRGTEIMRTRPGEVAGRGSAGTTTGPRVTGETDPALAPLERLDGAPVPGAALVPLTKEATVEQMAVFSRVGEFVRNIHWDLDVARRGGLAVPIVQGQQQVCWLAELLARTVGLGWFSTGWLSAKFLVPVRAFDVVEVGGVVREVTGAGEVALDVWVRGADGALATVGWATARLSATA